MRDRAGFHMASESPSPGFRGSGSLEIQRPKTTLWVPAKGQPRAVPPRRASRAVAHGLDQGALGQLAEDAPQCVQFAAQLFHPLAQAVIVTGQLQHLLLRLHVALLGLVPALAHRDVVALAPHPVLVAVLTSQNNRNKTIPTHWSVTLQQTG